MRITKTAVQVTAAEERRVAANAGCNRCPCCGEARSVFECIRDGKPGGITSGIYQEEATGFFKIKQSRRDLYVCNTCGAEWESELY